ncbi:uncharacterized protein EI97DRAFT_441000 [Westerdykella ornata]|uniref:Uncharacterized protein n=1 Tax=Westerdykella ornata TaxID=318751 RepID=A0A6A6JR26_WESOR|nr:uncharacterized protein EI97DRAFT_441000 [Westerdykella ornata]KAF2278553.1 hypothetical protein EI97DRAFT_441000 [Westerdykella ornata]
MRAFTPLIEEMTLLSLYATMCSPRKTHQIDLWCQPDLPESEVEGDQWAAQQLPAEPFSPERLPVRTTYQNDAINNKSCHCPPPQGHQFSARRFYVAAATWYRPVVTPPKPLGR